MKEKIPRRNVWIMLGLVIALGALVVLTGADPSNLGNFLLGLLGIMS